MSTSTVSVGRVIELAAVAERLGDVGAATELHAEQHVDRVVQHRREVGDRGVERDQRRPQRRELGEHRPEQRRVDDAVGHRTRLVDGDHDLLGEAALAAAEPDEALGDHRAVLGLVVAQVGVDRARASRCRRAGASRPVAHGRARRAPPRGCGR